MHIFIYLTLICSPVRAATWLQHITSQISVWKRTHRWPFATSESCLASNQTTIWLVCKFTTSSFWFSTVWRKFQLIRLQQSLNAKIRLHPSEFQYSICNEPLIELSNPGASSSWFYLTSDDEFIIKTVQHKEAEFLQKLLPGYYMVSSFSNSHYIYTNAHICQTAKSGSLDIKCRFPVNEEDGVSLLLIKIQCGQTNVLNAFPSS